IQPDVIQGLTRHPGFRGRGLLGRFLYSMPASPVGHRRTDPPPVPETVRAIYHHNVLELFQLPATFDEEGHYVSKELHLDPAAQEARREFEAWLEPQLAEDGDLASISDWAGKLSGA